MKCGAIRGIIGGKIPFDPNIITLEELTQHTSPYLLCWVELATSDTFAAHYHSQKDSKSTFCSKAASSGFSYWLHSAISVLINFIISDLLMQ